MADPHSTDPTRTGGTQPDPDRDAKIDGLLLAGLEHYFAGRFQEAINVWERVLFLDRGHARARAYIERARSALAERQRQSEELVHEGVAAMQRGDSEAARELLSSATAAGASPDLALAYLDRLDRLTGAPAPEPRPADASTRPPRLPPSLAAPEPGRRGPQPVRVLPLLALVVAGVAIVMQAASRDLLRPLVEMSWRRQASPAPTVVAPDPLPVPRAADLLLARARTLFSSGHLRDALAVLDGVPVADPVFPEAQRLRAEIQRGLLAAAGLPVNQGVTPRRGSLQ
jgi:tetratricopeptide (TPR) repeat protein